MHQTKQSASDHTEAGSLASIKLCNDPLAPRTQPWCNHTIDTNTNCLS